MHAALLPLLLCFIAPASLQAQPVAGARALEGHVPLWANQANFAAAVPAEEHLQGLTLVLAPSADRQQALAALLDEQYNPASPNYHRWLTPVEFGERFGLTTEQLATVTTWLESEGLHVDQVANGRRFINFSGTAGQVAAALHTSLGYYTVHGERRMAPVVAPMLPEHVAGLVHSVRGLFTLVEKPMSHAEPQEFTPGPEMTSSNGNHYIAPADFNTIYNLPATSGLAGLRIGIVGRARVCPQDIQQFVYQTGVNVFPPNEVIPPTGADPGPALTAPPAAGVSIEDQLEATLDVERAGSTAPGANLLLVIATQASGGIYLDTQYLVDTTPVPAPIVNISFGACESSAGSYWVQQYDNLYKQAAAEGVSVFVSSGDSGASGCDTAFKTPPATPAANSPNYLCSSSYVTCVGGTEFADTASPSTYWNSSNSYGFGSALRYIPEGGWNEPLTSSSTTQVAASGGGVSAFVPTPSWQTGAGVPSARGGRYTPDVAFSASAHDGYFGCMAAAGTSTINTGCVPDSTGHFYFVYFSGTSAAAPSMAGITALLDTQFGAALGNLNPTLYSLASGSSGSTIFHDVTPTSSGVSGCNVNIPSMCNNSAPGQTGLTGGQAGYPLTVGYDEVTGLGSLNVKNFLSGWPVPPTGGPATITPTSLSFAGSATMTGNDKYVNITNPAASNLYFSSITLTGTGAGSFHVSNDCLPFVPSGSSCFIDVTFYPTNPGSYSAILNVVDNASNSPQEIPLSGTAFNATSTTLALPASQGTLGSTINLRATVAGGSPTGSVVFAVGAKTLGRATLSGGAATLSNVAVTGASGFGIGTNQITATYSGDANDLGSSATGQFTVFVPGVPLLLFVSSGPYGNFAYSYNGAQTLTISGGNFNAGSTVLWDGLPRPTTFVSVTELTVQISAADLSVPHTAMVSVVNSTPNAGTSVAFPFWIYGGPNNPSIQSISIANAPDATGAYPVMINVGLPSVTAVTWYYHGSGNNIVSGLVSVLGQAGGTVSASDVAPRPITVSAISGLDINSNNFILQ